MVADVLKIIAVTLFQPKKENQQIQFSKLLIFGSKFISQEYYSHNGFEGSIMVSYKIGPVQLGNCFYSTPDEFDVHSTQEWLP